jgi:hypothetical protein
MLPEQAYPDAIRVHAGRRGMVAEVRAQRLEIGGRLAVGVRGRGEP